MRLFKLDIRKWINLDQIVCFESCSYNGKPTLVITMSNGEIITIPEDTPLSAKFDEHVFAYHNGRLL